MSFSVKRLGSCAPEELIFCKRLDKYRLSKSSLAKNARGFLFGIFFTVLSENKMHEIEPVPAAAALVPNAPCIGRSTHMLFVLFFASQRESSIHPSVFTEGKWTAWGLPPSRGGRRHWKTGFWGVFVPSNPQSISNVHDMATSKNAEARLRSPGVAQPGERCMVFGSRNTPQLLCS